MIVASKVASGLTKTRMGIRSAIGSLWKKDRLSREDYIVIEEALLLADVGLEATTALLQAISDSKHQAADNRSDIAVQAIVDLLRGAIDFQTKIKKVIIIVGVNGTGKTTSTAKLAAHYAQMGERTLLVAADTYRAAAVEQLALWAKRSGVTMYAPTISTDPAALAYLGVQHGLAENYERIIIDTAGRIHTSRPLLEQLAKLHRVVAKHSSDVSTLLVLDATVGQSGITQARKFAEHVDLHGYILTKMDGTARGGVAIPIMLETKLPVQFTGVGEALNDFTLFDTENYIRGLLVD